MMEKVTAMYKPNPEKALEYAQEIAERSLDLARAQLEATEKIYSAVSRDYRDLLAKDDQAAMLQAWPKVIESAARSSTEGMAVLLKNAVNYQSELIRMMQSRVPELNEKILESIIQSTRAATTMTDTPAARSSRHAGAGAANLARTSKAA